MLGKKSHYLALIWLSIISIAFYSYWKLKATPILILSILLNYFLSKKIIASLNKKKILFIIGVTLNLLILAYFKYVNFFITNVNYLLESSNVEKINFLEAFIPLGISFFTFTQIGYLADSYQGKVKESNFLHYFIFVTFFPHLIAGPIINHNQIMPQFNDAKGIKFNSNLFAQGLSLFFIGLAKKIIIADSLATAANNFFDNASTIPVITFSDSWLGSLAFTFQLYFDFSGYSDMAVGLALLFGIYLPLNFNSPLKAQSIIDFWQRWHMTLTGYIGQYLYTPITLFFTRLSIGKSFIHEILLNLATPTILIFLIIGFWHGANWTFILFGLVHGVFVVTNHLWRKVKPIKTNGRVIAIIYWLITLISVNIGFVLFRSKSTGEAIKIYKGMLNFFNFGSSQPQLKLIILLILAITISLKSKNSQEICGYVYPKSLIHPEKWSKLLAIFLGLIFLLSLLMIKKPTPFLYFNF